MQVSLPQLISDHCPINLYSNGVDWGPKPFRFEKCWLEHKDFLNLARVWWSQVEVTGYVDYRLCKKLQVLKEKIKTWTIEVFG